MKKMTMMMMLTFMLGMVSCSSDNEEPFNVVPIAPNEAETSAGSTGNGDTGSSNTGDAVGDVSTEMTTYTDKYGDVAYIPAQFRVSSKYGEQDIREGLVVIGPDGSEFVWVPTKDTPLKMRDFGSYFSGNSLANYSDDTSLSTYQDMVKSVSHFGGFYMGRYEASYGGGSSLADYVPASKPVTENSPGRIWVQFSPQDATVACANLYRNNPTVQGFFPWGCNWDTTLQWLIDTGYKTYQEVASNSTSWGNYSDDPFSEGARGNYTGAYEQARAHNIYDMAGNNWEWTQERHGGSNYVMRGGGYNLMGGSCSGSRYPAAIRDPLPGNNHHPNVCFRIGLFLVVESEPTGLRDATM